MGTLINGIKEIFSSSQSTATHIPTCQSDGTPTGRISVGDLAPVLRKQEKTIQNNDNLNDAKFRVIGDVYICNASSTGNTVTNTPRDGSFGPFRLEIVSGAGSSFPMQRIYRAAKNLTEVYVRYYESSWGEWQRLDNFGCTTSAGLASLLGGVIDVRANSDNVDSLTETGKHLHGGSIGSGSSYGILQVINTEGIYCVQIDFGGLGGNATLMIKIRSVTRSSQSAAWGTWSSWKTVTLT